MSVQGLCVTGWGNPPLSPALVYDDVNGDIREREEGENWRVEPGGKGCAIIRSLRGGMCSVVETLSLRIRAEPPNSPVAAEGEYLYVTDTGKEAPECDFFHVSVSLPVCRDCAVN